MRLSEVKGERALDVIAELVDPVANIAQDPDVTAMFTGEGEIADKARKAVPALLKGHRSDVVAILSTIAGVAPEEYVAEMSLESVIRDVYELITDEELLAFLSSFDTVAG